MENIMHTKETPLNNPNTPLTDTCVLNAGEDLQHTYLSDLIMTTRSPGTSLLDNEGRKVWNVGHFPDDTDAGTNLDQGEESEFTGSKVLKYSAGEYVIMPRPSKSFGFYYYFNISYCHFNISYVTNNDSFTKVSSIHKQDGYMPPHALVSFMCARYLKPDMLLKVYNLTAEVSRQGLLRVDAVSGKLVYNKKKLLRAIKRLINKYLAKHKVVGHEEDDADSLCDKQNCLTSNLPRNSKQLSTVPLSNGDGQPASKSLGVKVSFTTPELWNTLNK